MERDGLTLVYGDPLTPHGRTAGWLAKEFARHTERHLGSDMLDSLDFSTEEDFNIPGYGVKVPDLSIIPQNARRGLSIPCVVVEVGYHNERSFEEVKEEVYLWAGYGCPIVIGVKITDNAPLATVNNPCIEVLLKLQGHQDRIIHLGQASPAPCTHSGTHKINIRAALLLPSACRAVRTTQDLSILQFDLYPMQERIKEWVVQH